VQKRGWEIFGLAFLFRLQSYVLSGGPSLMSLLKVDILNIMGLAIALTALAGRAVHTKAARFALFAGLAGAISLLTPAIRATAALAWLPDPVEWYFRPVPGRTNFTLFPWAGFVFAGAASGVVIDSLRDAARGTLLQVRLAVAGAMLVWLAHEGSFLPSILAGSEYWTSSPSFFLLRVGVLTLLLPVAYAWTQVPWRRKANSWSPLEEFGRASLFVYWIHVEMVYGFFSRPIRRALTLEGAVTAYVLFTVFLFALVRLKGWLLEDRAIYLTDTKSAI
jgi:uncharacterized membrane protein